MIGWRKRHDRRGEKMEDRIKEVISKIEEEKERRYKEWKGMVGRRVRR